MTVVPPDFDWYVQNSKALIRILGDYSPDIEQYSIDEAVFGHDRHRGVVRPGAGNGARHPQPCAAGELGFTVNIGVAPNRLLAKMASDFEKPDKVHLLLPEDVPPPPVAAAGARAVRRGAQRGQTA